MAEQALGQAPHPDHVENVRAAIAASVAAVKMTSADDVLQHFGRPVAGGMSELLYQRIKAALPSTSETGFDTHALRAVAGAFRLEQAVGAESNDNAEVLTAISAGLPAGTELKLPSDACWIEAATIGRALLALDVYRHPDHRHLAVAAAAARLTESGFVLKLTGTSIDPMSPAVEDVTAAISERFVRLGLMDVLGNLLAAARRVGVYDFDQYLFGRRYAYEEREPSIPFGFLLNLAAKARDRQPLSARPDLDWRESIEFARDLVAVLDVEPYNKFWMIEHTPRRMERLLGEIGLYDHLFGVRQWSIFVTPLLLKSFFGTSHDAKLSAYLGWNASDAVLFSGALVRSIRTDPARLRREDLLSTGLSSSTLDHMLPSFVHSAGEVNRDYGSPLRAKSADLMFRPLLEGGGSTFVAPAASMVGPACYEVVATAARAALSKEEVAELVGKGTERAVAALLRFRRLEPSFEGAKYNEGKPIDAGECDLVFEDHENILLIECKGKALTRATMSADPGAALLDYAGGVLASQVQALQHERLLHDNGEILFDDGTRLVLRGRRVTRLSVTLLDHGTLQDRFLFINLVEPLLRSELVFNPKDPSRRRYREVNDELDRHRREMKAAERRSDSAWEEALGASSLSFGQLATLLVETDTLGGLIERIRKPATFATMNPLLEYHYLKKQGLHS